jgi:hypothetical protein
VALTHGFKAVVRLLRVIELYHMQFMLVAYAGAQSTGDGQGNRELSDATHNGRHS